MSNKKILYVTTVNSTINAFLVPHIRYLKENGNWVECACNINKEIKDHTIKLNKINFSRNPFSFKNIKAYIEIQELVKLNSYDIVHVHTPVASFVTRLALRNFKSIEIVYTAHGFHFYKGATWRNWLIYYPLEKLAAKWTDKLITINNEDFNLAKKKLRNARCDVFNINGIGIELEEYTNSSFDLDFKRSLGVEDNDFVITIIAELIERKNHKQIIEAISLIKGYDTKILFVGDGKLRKNLEEMVKDKCLEGEVLFLGFRKDVPKIIAISDVIALFSLQEGLPRNLMEAMAQKKPIICTNIRGNNDLVEDNVNGFLVGINEVLDTKSKLIKLKKSKNECLKMGIKGKEKLGKYSIENILNEMNKIYKK